MTLEARMGQLGRAARVGAAALRTATAEQRTAAIRAMARAIPRHAEAILAANARDMEEAAAKGISGPMLERGLLNPDRVAALAKAIDEVADIPDPVGAEIARWTRPNGLDIARVRTPIGVVAILYESRPNVTADAAALCVRSGHAAILRGGSECIR